MFHILEIVKGYLVWLLIYLKRLTMCVYSSEEIEAEYVISRC